MFAFWFVVPYNDVVGSIENLHRETMNTLRNKFVGAEYAIPSYSYEGLPEDAENGEMGEATDESTTMTAKEIQELATYAEKSDSHGIPRWLTVYESQDMYTGGYPSRTYHLDNVPSKVLDAIFA